MLASSPGEFSKVGWSSVDPGLEKSSFVGVGGLRDLAFGLFGGESGVTVAVVSSGVAADCTLG